jgi:hypothetical protein
VHSPQLAYAWSWFFNHFAMPRFDRALCVDRLGRHLRLTQARLPSHKTLQREVACLLQSYATPVPLRVSDPEDAQDCPFLELGLLTHFIDSGTYRLRDDVRRSIPLEILGYAVSKVFLPSERATHVEFGLREATIEAGAPGRVFVLSGDSLFDLVIRLEHVNPKTVSVRAIAGERLIRMPARIPMGWVEGYYEGRPKEHLGAA